MAFEITAGITSNEAYRGFQGTCHEMEQTFEGEMLRLNTFIFKTKPQ